MFLPYGSLREEEDFTKLSRDRAKLTRESSLIFVCVYHTSGPTKIYVLDRIARTLVLYDTDILYNNV